MDINKPIFDKLNSLSGRMTVMEQKVENRDKAHNKGQLHSPNSTSSSQSTKSQEEDALVMPTLSALRQSWQLQSQVDQRL